MNSIVKDSIKHTKFNNLVAEIKNNEKNLSMTGLTPEAATQIIYGIYNYTSKKPVIVCPNMSTARKYIENLKFYSETEIVLFPEREFVYHSTIAKSRDTENERIYAIKKILNNDNIILVTTISAVLEEIVDLRNFRDLNFEVVVGKELIVEDIIKRLEIMGYVREELVDAEGKYSVRGGIIDIFALGEEYPYRIELFGNEVDTIRRFNKETQRSIDNVDRFYVSYSSEFIISQDKKMDLIEKLNEIKDNIKNKELIEIINSDIDKIANEDIFQVIDKYFKLIDIDKTTLLELLNENYTIYYDEVGTCINRSKQITEEEEEIMRVLEKNSEVIPKYVSRHFSFEDILTKTNCLSNVYLSRLNQDRVLHAKRKEYSFSCREVNFFRSSMDLFIKEIKKFKDEGKIVCIVFSSDVKIDMMLEALQQENIHATKLYNFDELDTLEKSKVYISKGILTNGYVIEDLNIVVASEELTKIKKQNIKKTSTELLGDAIRNFDDLKVGDYVVHVTYGIGKYLGTETITTEKVSRDYIKIEYKDSSALYIPITSLDLIRKYTAEDGFVPKLNSLTSSAWEKTKQRVKAHVKDIAKDLVKLYAERKEAVGFKFLKDTPWQQEFEADFEYELTNDQRRAVEDIKKDMESSVPMDRILCGDVGYGKTEVALRAAFKAVMSSKQVAYLVPTTVLSEQQYLLFKSRMEKYGIKVEMLSRFRSKSEQDKIIEDLKEGKIDVVVGTHRMLSKDVKFKDLGFLIIDEEHKFGVEHKEKIKTLRKNIDVLSMTATPIPRTLHMSMIGIYDISVILEPPLERIPVKTYVMEYDEHYIKEAIEKELARDGQVIYLNNRVENIEEITHKVRSMVPTANIDFAHGKMSPQDIEDKLLKFMNNETNILVCTTILESGIDIPNANTLIIENADKLGLASLYQIRGRVGRSSRLAYAYVTYRKNIAITEESMKRLNAIKEYTEFGSGLKIALKDLEIRGAGNILGAEQHGHMISVGYDMYMSLLKEAINMEKKEKSLDVLDVIENKKEDVKITLDVSANLPEDYIKDSVIKINVYQKLSNAETEEELSDITDELIDRFGEIPEETKNLIDIINIRNIARKKDIKEIKTNDYYLVINSNYGQNNIKYKLTDSAKCDILSFIKDVLLNFEKKS